MKFSENGSDFIKVKAYQKCFVCFLLKENDVVYVGQTSDGIKRPFSHKDKDFDNIVIYPCDLIDLDFLEEKFIVKYNPKYNKTYDKVKMLSLETARNRIKEYLNAEMFSIAKLRLICEHFDISLIRKNKIEYILNEDLLCITNFVKEYDCG